MLGQDPPAVQILVGQRHLPGLRRQDRARRGGPHRALLRDGEHQTVRGLGPRHLDRAPPLLSRTKVVAGHRRGQGRVPPGSVREHRDRRSVGRGAQGVPRAAQRPQRLPQQRAVLIDRSEPQLVLGVGVPQEDAVPFDGRGGPARAAHHDHRGHLQRQPQLGDVDRISAPVEQDRGRVEIVLRWVIRHLHGPGEPSRSQAASPISPRGTAKASVRPPHRGSFPGRNGPTPTCRCRRRSWRHHRPSASSPSTRITATWAPVPVSAPPLAASSPAHWWGRGRVP